MKQLLFLPYLQLEVEPRRIRSYTRNQESLIESLKGFMQKWPGSGLLSYSHSLCEALLFCHFSGDMFATHLSNQIFSLALVSARSPLFYFQPYCGTLQQIKSDISMQGPPNDSRYRGLNLLIILYTGTGNTAFINEKKKRSQSSFAVTKGSFAR